MEYILANRSILRLSGADAVSFLQGLVTANVETLKPTTASLCAMLSPQGKLTHDFFLYRTEDELLLDVATTHASALQKKLKLYKMRADVSIELMDETHSVVQSQGALNPAVVCAQDARTEGLGYRSIVAKCEGDDSEAYDAWRMEHIIPEAEMDGTDRTFLLDLGYDALGAVDFEKGCYVGQEVTARMHYKNARRRAPYGVQADQALPELGTEIFAGDVKVGELRSSAQHKGIAVCQWADVQKHAEVGFTANGVPLRLSVPQWFELTHARISEGKEEAL